MTTNFFQGISSLEVNADWHLIIKQVGQQMIVTVRLCNEKVGDDARKLIPAFNLTGTVQEMNDTFFEQVQKPMEAASKLMTNMEQFMKGLEQAKLQSKMEQDNKQKRTKEENDSIKKYDGQMKKVHELKEQKKYGEAINQLPKAEDYPDKEDELNELHDELWQLRKEKENTMF